MSRCGKGAEVVLAKISHHVGHANEVICGRWTGSRLLRLLANRFRGDLVLTIAGFHAGPGAVLKYDGIPPYETTQLYVRMVLRDYLGPSAAAAPAAGSP